MHISTEAIVEKQHQCNITVALYYIIARYYSRVESQHVCLTHIFFQPKWGKIYTHSSIALFFAKAQYEELLYYSVTWNPIHQIQSQTSFHDPILVFGSLYIEAKLSLRVVVQLQYFLQNGRKNLIFKVEGAFVPKFFPRFSLQRISIWMWKLCSLSLLQLS